MSDLSSLVSFHMACSFERNREDLSFHEWAITCYECKLLNKLEQMKRTGMNVGGRGRRTGGKYDVVTDRCGSFQDVLNPSSC